MCLSLIKGMRVWLVSLLCLAAGGAKGGIVISEFLADNENGVKDEDGDREDWVELYNSEETAVNLDGWWLTDKASDKTQWRIPNVSIKGKGTLLVWASGKNRASPAAPLHANFSLSKSGEYLGLYQPDPTNGLPVLVDEYAPKFPALPSDVSYGRMAAQTTTTFVASGEVGKYRVLTSAEGATAYTGTVYTAGQIGHNKPGGWNVSPAFDDASWTQAATGIGYDTDGDFLVWVGASPSGNCQTALRNVNTSLCFRRTFCVPDPSNVVSLTLRMRYEDGFVAYLNGTEVGRANCTNAMAYNTAANAALNEAIVDNWTTFAISNKLIVAGTNLLAIQGLNVTAGSTDFVLLPEITATVQASIGSPVYFSVPTPGAVNNAGTGGPLLYEATPADPDVPRPAGNSSSPPMTVTVKALRTKNNIAFVRAVYGTMWNAESNTVYLYDNGVAPDAAAGDGIYSAALPTTGPASGQMFRWRFEAQDVLGTATKLPAYIDPLDSPQYFGTVAANPSMATSQLPVLEWFVQSTNAYGPSLGTFRGSCYYLSNFYDNVGHTLHGQSSRGFPKKSYNFDLTGEVRFQWKAGEQRVKNFNLLSNYADKTKTRNTFSHWVGIQADTPCHYAFPVRVQLNGGFHGVMDLVEDGGDRMLDRNGLDPDGALYKVYDTVFTNLVEKKTREYEDNSDLTALYVGLDTTKALTNRQIFAYDNVDIAATVNYLVTRFLNSDQDHGHKNYYLYRDSNLTREWRPIIWDVDLSQGHVWNSTDNYFDDHLITNVPFSAGSGSRVYNIIYTAPEMKQMFVRRMRTLMDTLMQPPGTTNGLFEAQMRALAATVDPDPANPSPWTDGDLDAARWGFHTNFVANRPREEVERVITNYFAPRRAFLFNKGAGRPTYNGLNLPDAAQTNVPGMVVIDSIDYMPASGTQAHEYVILRNTTAQAVDISGWSVDGEIKYTFKGGTVIPAGAGTAATNYVGLLHLVKDAYAFLSRPAGPTGGQRRFIQGNYDGQLSARGGTLNLRDNAGLLIATYTYAGTPTAGQQKLRVTELMYHPAEPTDAEKAALIGVTADDFEYIELLNLGPGALPVTGAWFSQGIAYTFPVLTLAATQRVVLAKNPVAFGMRYPGAATTVLGPYEGFLDNKGERLELKDACGETILDFEYKDGWYPDTDGKGRSLVVRNAGASYNAFGDAASWGICSAVEGTPGSADTTVAQAYHGWDNFHFTSAQRDNLLVGGPYADPDGDGRVNWVEYALGTDPWVPDGAPLGFSFVDLGEQKFAALHFNRPSDVLDVQYEIEATGDLLWEVWSPAGSVVHGQAKLDDWRESVILRETSAATARQRFYKLRLTFGE